MSVLGISIKPTEWSGQLPRIFRDRVMLTLVTGLAALTWWDSQQGLESLRFTLDNLVGIAPFLLASIGLRPLPRRAAQIA